MLLLVCVCGSCGPVACTLLFPLPLPPPCPQRRQALATATLEEEYRFCCPETNPVLADLLSVADRLLTAKPELKADVQQALADNVTSEEFLGPDNMRMLEYVRQGSYTGGEREQ